MAAALFNNCLEYTTAAVCDGVVEVSGDDDDGDAAGSGLAPGTI